MSSLPWQLLLMEKVYAAILSGVHVFNTCSSCVISPKCESVCYIVTMALQMVGYGLNTVFSIFIIMNLCL